MINALLGVNDTDLFRDYEISMMSSAGTADNQTANNGSIDDLSKNGFLDKFELALRHKNSNDFFVDSIKVNLIQDTVPPVITYNGKNNITISQGQTLNFDVSAVDAVQVEIEVERVWGDLTKIDGSGNPLPGEHTLTFKATDYFGNTATHTVNLTVIEPDTVAPVITLPTQSIFIKTGTTPIINLTVTDDKDQNVTVEYAWSQGALNSKKELNEGVHTLTITATDASNNKTVKTITFTVTENGDGETNVIDEEQLFPDVNDDQNDSENQQETSSSESVSNSESLSESDSNSIAKKGNGFSPLFIIIPLGLTTVVVGVIIFLLKLKRK